MAIHISVMRYRSGQTPTAAIIVASVFALMFIGTVTFFVYQFQKGGSTKKTTNTTNVAKTNKNKNTNTKNKNSNANQNTNTAVTLDLTPLAVIPDAWQYYTNSTVNYSIRYPATWQLQEVSIAEHPVQKIAVGYIKFSNPNGQVTMTLGIRKVGATYGIGERTTSPTGTLQSGLKLSIGTTPVPTTDLVATNKVQAIFYYPVKPFGYLYIDGREIQAELDITSIPGAPQTITDLLATADTQIANTILSSLAFSDVTTSLTPPPPSAPPLGQFRIETFKATPQAVPDTRLVNTDGGTRTVVIDSTRSRAGLANGHGLMPLVFPAFGTTLYLQDASLQTGSVGGAIWTYDVTTKRLTKQASYPPVGWGKIAVNQIRTRAAYVSSTDVNDSGLVQNLYYLDLVKNTLTTLVTLRSGQSFSAGWGGTNNSISLSFLTDGIIRYAYFDQNSGNKQTKLPKTKLGDGQVVVPGANPAIQ